MDVNHLEKNPTPADGKQMEQPDKRKKFQGFSLGFLLVLLALVVGIYIVCLMVAG